MKDPLIKLLISIMAAIIVGIVVGLAIPNDPAVEPPPHPVDQRKLFEYGGAGIPTGQTCGMRVYNSGGDWGPTGQTCLRISDRGVKLSQAVGVAEICSTVVWAAEKGPCPR